MNTDLKYVESADGVHIAYAVSGQGPPLIHMPNVGASMLGLERQVPERERWSSLLNRRFTLVRYDARGVGYSQRDVADVSLEAHLLDLKAVASELGLRSFVLFGFLWSAYVAPHFAAQFPEQVTHLILWPPDVRSMSSDEYRSLGRLAASDWHTFTETYAHLALGWDEGDAAHRYAGVMRESVAQETFLRQMTERQDSMEDLIELAPDLEVPTLVLQRRMRFATERVGWLTTALPDARLRILDGDSTVPYLGDTPAVVEAMAEFVGAGSRLSTTGAASGGVRDEQDAGTEMTPRELEVLRLLAQGNSNQQIADELVLSVRTVERHLTNVYTKLGATGKSARAAAAAYASRLRFD